MQGNNHMNASFSSGTPGMAEHCQRMNDPMFRPMNMNQTPVKYNPTTPIIHDFMPSHVANMTPPFWRPTALDFEQSMEFNPPSIVRQVSESDLGVNMLMQKEHVSSIDTSQNGMMPNQSSGYHPVPVPMDMDCNESRSGCGETSSFMMDSSGLDEPDPVSSVSSVSVSTGGSLPYTSLCLVGTPSSTVAEYQPESVPYHSEGTYTLLESQKGKEVDLEKEAEFYDQSKMVLCDLCGKRFESDSALNKHRRHHSGLQPHVCHVCGKGFPWKAKLDNHMITHTDSTNKPFMCEVCGKHFRNHGYMLMHTKMHRAGRMYRCSLCGRELLRLNHLKKHLELKHTKEGIFEGRSMKLYTSNEFLNRTMRISKDDRYESKTCEYCEIELPDEGAYMIHKKVHLAKGEVKCRYCAKVVYNYSYLKMHEKSHTMVKSHKCDLCGKKFHRFSQLRNHMHTHAWIRKTKCKTVVKLDMHGALVATENNTCLVCDKTFPTVEEFQEHNQQHTVDDKTYRCVLCEKSFDGLDSLSQLRHHMMKCHRVDKPFKCKQCEKSFFKGNQLKCHMKVHSKDKPFKCNVCEESFLRENQLRVHHASHTGEKPFPCDKCEKRFSSPAALRTHKIIHDENAFLCKLCYKPMSTKSNMDYHMVKVHSASSGGTLVYCDVCNVPFSRMSYVNTHMQESHKGYVAKGTTKCPKCPRRFVRKSSLKVHMRAHASEKPFKCDVCGKGFVIETSMKNHKKSHFNAAGELNTNPLQCDICRKMFKRPIDCHKHQVTHSKIQLYKCDLCGKGFAYPHSLKRHKEGHFEIKSKKKAGPRNAGRIEMKEYKCDLCKAKFPIEELLDEHKNSHFDDDHSFECPVCGDGFRRKGDLKKHQKTHEENTAIDAVDDELTLRSACIYECDVCEEKFRSLVELQIHDEIHCISPKRLEKMSESSESESTDSSHSDDSSDSKDSSSSSELPEEKPARGRESGLVLRSGQGLRSGQSRSSVQKRRSLLIRGQLKTKSTKKSSRGSYSRRTTNGFPNRGDMMRNNNTMKTVRTRVSNRKTISKVRFECNQCYSHFASILELKNHMDSHKDLKPLLCSVCNEAFYSNKTLEMHLESHSGFVFTCEACGFKFCHHIDLNNHITADHPELVKRRGRPKKKPYTCTICRMCFSMVEHLEAHEMMHTASVRLRREVFDMNTVKLSDLNHLCEVKCEVDDSIDLFGSTTSDQRDQPFHNNIHNTTSPDLPLVSPVEEFEPPEIADAPTPESPENFDPPEIADVPSPQSETQLDPSEVVDIPTPESPVNFNSPEIVDDPSSPNEIHLDPSEVVNMPTPESPVNFTPPEISDVATLEGPEDADVALNTPVPSPNTSVASLNTPVSSPRTTDPSPNTSVPPPKSVASPNALVASPSISCLCPNTPVASPKTSLPTQDSADTKSGKRSVSPMSDIPEPSNNCSSSGSDKDLTEMSMNCSQPAYDVFVMPEQAEDPIQDIDKCFKCSVCDSYFAKSSGLENHLTVHTDIQPKWRLHLVPTATSMYACIHINIASKSCVKSFDDL